MLHVQESVNLKIYLYAQTMGQPRMLYIRKFYVVKYIYIYIYIYIYLSIFTDGTEGHIWHVTIYARGGGGGLGGGVAKRPHQLGVGVALTPERK